MTELLKIAGIVVAVSGLAVEGLAILAMSYYAVRKRVPNPFLLQTLGFLLFVFGAVTAIGAVAWMRTVQEVASL